MDFEIHGIGFCRCPPGFLICIVLIVSPAPSLCGFLEPPTPVFSLSALEEGVARLPCRFEPKSETQTNGTKEVVQQVAWFKVPPENEGAVNREQIILFHTTMGQHVFDPYKDRVSFEKAQPIANSALLIRGLTLEDQGDYVCQVITFPSGNFETTIKLSLLSLPVSSLDPASPPLVEGSALAVAAVCTAWGVVPPTVAWETGLEGSIQLNQAAGGKVTNKFWVRPSRGMNGEKLDCLITHQSLSEPRRIPYTVVVHYPPDVSLTGYGNDWFVGMESGALKCVGKGNPEPNHFTWTRRDSALPDGVSVVNGSLSFPRPLELSDSGVYICRSSNRAGFGEAKLEIRVSETEIRKADSSSVVMIAVGVVVAVLLVTLVIAVLLLNRHHKRRNKELERALNMKTEELSSLSRQTSFRRLNSINTDPRSQTDESIPLREEAIVRQSSISLVDNSARSRDSRSTLSTVRGVSGFPGRPHLHRDDEREETEEDEEAHSSRLRVESFVRSSTRSLRPGLRPPLNPSLLRTHLTRSLPRSLPRPLPRERTNGSARHLTERRLWDSSLGSQGEESQEREESYDELSEDGERGGQGEGVEMERECITEALSQHFHMDNGTLRPKPTSNGIFIHPKAHFV
ncbi:nectin-4-like isoform X2 [Polyodon spathula]|uniref:nectin-4-like isoform X2 n=1 Tax=Polyodon spathula TaxID=7913 RepID=UPI001B7E50EC|nr:nectin-4-like isoform X2 [Polyodon spathula]